MRRAATGIWLAALPVAAISCGAALAQQAEGQPFPQTVRELPATFLVEPKPVQIDLGFCDFFPCASSRPTRLVPLEGFNATETPVELAAQPVASTLLDGSGAAATAVATAARLDFVDNRCAGPVLPAQSCTLALAFPTGLGPGEYSLDVAVEGTESRQSRRTVKVSLRAPALLAGLLVALGVLAGAAVADWRGGGRAATERRIAAEAVRRRARHLAFSARQPAVQRQAAAIESELLELDASLSDGLDQTALVEERRTRLDSLLLADQALTAAASARSTFASLSLALTEALDAADWSSDRVAKLLAALRAELAQFPLLVSALRGLESRIEAMRAAVEMLGAGHPAFATAWQDGLARREAALGDLGASDGGESAKRTAAVNAAAQALATAIPPVSNALLGRAEERLKQADAGQDEAARKRLADLVQAVAAARTSSEPADKRLETALSLARKAESAAPIGPLTESAAPPADDKPADVPTESASSAAAEMKVILAAGVFQAEIGASAAALRRSRAFWDGVANAILLAGVAGVGVLSLWVPDAAWGSVPDMLGALLAGAATRLTIGSIAVPQR